MLIKGLPQRPMTKAERCVKQLKKTLALFIEYFVLAFLVFNLFVFSVGKQFAKDMSSPTKRKKPELSTAESVSSTYHLLDGQEAQLASSSA